VQEMKVWPFAAALAEGGCKPPHAALAVDLVNMSGGWGLVCLASGAV